MFQTGSNIAVNDNISETLLSNQNKNAFPKIQKKPSSRSGISNKKDQFNRKNINLPMMKMRNSHDRINLKTDRYNQRQNKQATSNIFYRDIDPKLNMLIQAEYNNQTVQDDQQGFDFQLKVKKNKQLIRQSRKERQKIAISKQKKKNKKLNTQRIQKIVIRSPSPVEKKNINKIFNKRKSTQNASKQRDSIRGSVQYINPKFQQKSPKKPNLPPRMPKKNQSKNNNKINIKKPNENLFDNIQNFLDNPQQQRKKNQKVLIGLTLLKEKRDLEDKLKAINQKLQKKGQKIQQTTKSTRIDQYYTDGWRMLDLKEKGFDRPASDFDKQIDRINRLKNRTDGTLTDYVEFQQMLLQLSYQKKLNKK